MYSSAHGKVSRGRDRDRDRLYDKIDFNQRKKLERTETNLHLPSLTNLSCVKKTPDFGVSDDVIPNRLLPISF